MGARFVPIAFGRLHTRATQTARVRIRLLAPHRACVQTNGIGCAAGRREASGPANTDKQQASGGCADLPRGLVGPAARLAYCQPPIPICQRGSHDQHAPRCPR